MPAPLVEATDVLVPFAGLLVGAVLLWLWPRIEPRSASTRLALCLVVGLALLQLLLFRSIVDDAFITFRYSANLIQGNGPVFNASERVEGYSNFSWMVALAALGKLLPLPLPAIARLLGGLCTLAVVPLVHVLTLRATGGSARAGLLAALLTATAGSLLAHGASGLETGLFALLVLATIAAVDRRAFVAAGVVGALAMTTRPEGLLVAGCAIAVVLATRSDPERVRHALKLALGFLALVGPWTVWRYAYYGYWLPNSVAAKSGRDPLFQLGTGATDLLAFVLATPVMALALGAAALAIAGRVRAWPGLAPLLAGVSAVHLGFVVATGSDWMPAWRYFAPVLPVVAVLTLVLLHANPRTRPRIDSRAAVALVATLALVSLGISRLHSNMLPGVRYMGHAVQSLSEIGQWLSQTLPEQTLIAAYANGALPYHAGTSIRVLDLFGLTDEHIARRGRRAPRGTSGHAAFDNAYVLEREPQIITFLSRFATEPSCEVHRAFRPKYDGVSFRFPDSGNPLGRHANLYLLRSRRDELVALLSASPKVEIAPCP